MGSYSALPSRSKARQGFLAVLRDVETLFGFPPEVLRGRSRGYRLCRARAHAYCMMRDEGYSYGQIARFMGERSASTVRQSVRRYWPTFVVRRELQDFSRAELIEMFTQPFCQTISTVHHVLKAFGVSQSAAIFLAYLASEYPKAASNAQTMTGYDEVANELGHGNGAGMSEAWLRQLRSQIGKLARAQAWPEPFSDAGNRMNRLSEAFAELMHEKVGRPYRVFG